MKYDDLLNVPYVEGGRDKKGMDCYGLVLELSRRNGKPIKDINEKHIPENQLFEMKEKLNIKEIHQKESGFGDIMQCVYNGNLHIGFLIGKKTVIHATENGVRITPLIAFKNVRFGRVEK